MALQNIRSNTSHKRPDPSNLSDGQIAINTNADSPGLFFKDADGALIKAGPVHIGTSAPNSSPAVGGSTGNAVGEQWLDTTGGNYVLKVWDGTSWRDDLVSLASGSNDGLLSSSDFTKLSGIATGAEVNVDTDLSYNGSTRELASSTGTNVTLPEVVPSGNSGLITGADKTKLDGIAANAEVNVDTNLSYTASTRVLASSTGTNATLPEVSAGGNSGLLTGADKTKLDGIATGAEVNTVDSVAGKTGAVTLVKGDVGLGNVNNTSDANKPVSTATQTALNAKADLVGGVIPTSQIPALAITEFLGTVASQTAMLALTGQKGDWCLRSDKAVAYVITGNTPSQIGSWTAVTVPGSAVTTVNNQVGTVTLGASDVGAATTAQGNLADSAVQPGDNISTLNNNSGYLTSAATTAQGALADSAVQPGDNISTLTNNVGYITSADGGNAQTLDGINSTSFLRSDANDVKTAGYLRFNDSVQLQLGSGGDVSFFYNNADFYIDLNTAGDSFILRNNADSQLFKVDSAGNCINAGDIVPDTDNTGNVGTSALTWNSGRFTNLVIDSTISVRGAVDLADNDYLRFGSGDDILMFYNGADFYIDMQDANDNIYIRNSADAIVWRINGSGEVRYAGDIVPDTDNTGNVGTTALTWSNGQFSNLTINGTLNVRAAIDLADNDILRFGSGDDVEFFFNGSNFYLDLNAGGNNFIIRDGTTTRFTFDDNGSFTATGNVTAFSDITLKSNIELIPNALDKVCQIRGVTYERDDMNGERQSGVIAQEVEKVLPEVVRTNEEGIKSVAYGNLVGLLIESIKELKAEVEQLKGGIN